MTKEVLFPAHTTVRSVPANLAANEHSFFEKEYKKLIPESRKWSVKKISLTKEGIVFKNFRLIKQSLFTERISIEFGLKYRLKNLILNKKRTHKQKDCVLCFDSWYYGYFHWVTESLPKYLIALNQYPEGTFFIPEKIESFHYDSLMSLGFKANQLIPVEHTFCLENLIIFERIAPSGNYNDKIIRDLSKKIQKQIGIGVLKPTRKIFISRKKAKKRGIINENELSQMLGTHNFETIYLEDYSFIDQVRLFAETKSLVSIHGGGLTNMIFMREGSKVLEIRKENDNSNLCYFSLANAALLEYYYLFGKPIDAQSSVQNGDLSVSPALLEDIIRRF